jgi:MFS family permease
MQTDLNKTAPQALLSIAAVCAIAATALAVAMGIGRFAFTPLLPLMVRDQSLTVGAGAWLAASNYLGYLVGAVTVARLGLSPPVLMRASLVGIIVTTAAMGALDGTIVWIGLRCAAGVFSAWALVAVSAWALPQLAQASRTELSGVIYAGVGLGIAFTGLFCLAAAQPGVSARWLWLELGALAAIAVGLSIPFVGRTRKAQDKPHSIPLASADGAYTGLVICYGALGFGYILPATFLPSIARDVWDDPQIFGLAWPIFGIAAAVTTIVVAQLLSSPRANRLRVWAISHLIMAAGVILPSFWLNPVTIATAALAVGSTFMIATMLGLQEARSRSPDNPTALLAAMTAAFAVGQLAGPVIAGAIDLLHIGHHAALGYALQLAALALASSAVHLWHQSRNRRSA